MTPAEKQAFDAMREALKEACGNRCNAEYNPCYARAALAAADAVAEQETQGPQPMPDLTTLHANGAKAWAGVNAQDLREGKPVGEPPKPLGWYCVSADGMATLCADEEDAKQVAKESNLQWPRHGPHKAMQLCEYQESAPAG